MPETVEAREKDAAPDLIMVAEKQVERDFETVHIERSDGIVTFRTSSDGADARLALERALEETGCFEVVHESAPACVPAMGTGE